MYTLSALKWFTPEPSGIMASAAAEGGDSGGGGVGGSGRDARGGRGEGGSSGPLELLSASLDRNLHRWYPAAGPGGWDWPMLSTAGGGEGSGAGGAGGAGGADGAEADARLEGVLSWQTLSHKRAVRSLDCYGGLVASGSDGVVRLWRSSSAGLAPLQSLSLALDGSGSGSAPVHFVAVGRARVAAATNSS